eukprot:jgi/Psemu1/203802/e_gw1.333.9.1
MSSALHGTIVHRFQLPKSSSDVPLSKTTCLKKRNETRVRESCNDVDECVCCGFIFVPYGESPSNEYLLSFPKSLLKLACDACRLGREVLIRIYTEIPILRNYAATNNTEDDSLPSSSNSSSTVRSMIEVHELDLLPASYQEESCSSSFPSSASTDKCVNTTNDNSRNNNNFWTLTQFWRKERVDFQSIKNSRQKFTILATVNAISPIVSMDPSNPFALIEAYDKDNTDITCVIVLHGNQAMLNHSAIHPLDTLFFRDVVYKPWSVPKLLHCNQKANNSSVSSIFSHLKGRIPSHTIPSIVTPSNLITAIQGRIYNVSTLSVPTDFRVATVIHYVDMILIGKPDADSNDDENHVLSNTKSIETISDSYQPRCRLFLSHFPMSIALQWSLRPGAVLEAHNIHLVCLQPKSNESDSNTEIVASYGACLRSTLVLLKHSTDGINPIAVKTLGNQLDKRLESSEFAVSGVRSVEIQSFSTQPYDQPIWSTDSRSSAFQLRRKKLHASMKSNTGRQVLGGGCCSTDPHHAFLNHGFRKIDQNYLRTIFNELVENWRRRSFQGQLVVSLNNDRLKERVPKTWIVNVLLDFTRNKFVDKDSEMIRKRGSRDENYADPIPLQTKPKKLATRSPYFEFFDHSFSCQVTQQIDDGKKKQDFLCGCHLSMEDRKNSPSVPLAFLDLNEIRIASQRYFETHISRLLSSPSESHTFQQIRKGFNGSIRVPQRELYSCICNGRAENNNQMHDVECYIGGFVSEMHTQKSSGVASIADGACQVPIRLGERKSDHAGINDFIVGQFDSVMISCLCIGSLSKGFTENKKENVSSQDMLSSIPKSLSFPTLNGGKKQLLGNCSLVTIHGFLFVVAIQISCDAHRVLQATDTSSKGKCEGREKYVTLTVEECLETQMFLSEAFKSSTLVGMVTRCQFYSKMNLDGSYKCCRLMISSLKRDDSHSLESDNSCLQTFEMTLSVMPNTARMIKFNEMLDIVWPGVNLMEAQRVLGSSFWVLGDSGRTVALTFGGSDDIMPGSSCSKLSIKVHFPCSSLQLTDLGYTCSQCTQDLVDAVFQNHLRDSKGDELNDSLTGRMKCRMFDFVGGLKVVNGMLQRRPSRKNINQLDNSFFRPIGELNTEPSNAIPMNTLSELHELIYQSLREPFASRKIMNPTLVRRISKCRFVSLSFCQVQCYCTRCQCSLVHPSVTQKGSAGVKKRKREEVRDEVSFWHLPHIEGYLTGTHCTSSCHVSIDKKQDSSLSPNIQSSTLCCPKKNCPKNMFGVKWECSGILDDGTGQATLYADGDAALTLLGMSTDSIQTIEDGVWSTTGGNVQFMKSIPPPKQLRDKVINILATPRRESNMKESKVSDLIGLLSAQDRVTYLLERHCRVSNRPRRYLDYYVRCKPLVTKNKHNMIPHLQHTKINNFFKDRDCHKNESFTVHRSQVSSYTVPTLKLELVDCGVHEFQSLRPPCGKLE